MAFSKAEVRRALQSKLGFEMDAGARHPTFIYRDGDQVVAKTHISHGRGRDLSEGVVAAMARQLGVTAPQLRGAIDCRISCDGFRHAEGLGFESHHPLLVNPLETAGFRPFTHTQRKFLSASAPAASSISLPDFSSEYVGS
jgi:hypothetical protein